MESWGADVTINKKSWGKTAEETKMSGYRNSSFLDRLATQLKANKSASCRRAIQRILAVVKKNLEDGKYENDVEAETDFRQLVDRDEVYN
jgi:hypothetical protein